MGMKIGMLWFDNDPKTDLVGKIDRAVSYYRRKYGSAPNTCYVNPLVLAGGVLQTPGIAIKGNRQVMPNHFGVGVEA